jgi:rare lipoprotein A
MKQRTGNGVALARHEQMGAVRIIAILGLAGLVANCSGAGGKIDSKYGVAASPRVVADGQPVPKGGGRYQVGKPYQIAGRTFVPSEAKDYKAEGLASWYGSEFHGRLTANGEVFDRQSFTAAHPTLPLPSYVRVTNAANGKSIVVRVNDRGPFHGNRLLDVSRRTAEVLGFDKVGTAKVRVAYEGPAALEGSDDARLLATYREEGRNAPPPTAFALAPTTAPVTTAPVQLAMASVAPTAVAAGEAARTQSPVPMPVASPLMAAAPAVPVALTRGPVSARPAPAAPVRVAMADVPTAKNAAAPHILVAPSLPAPTPVQNAAVQTIIAPETTNASQRVSATWAAVGEPLALGSSTAATNGPALAISAR